MEIPLLARHSALFVIAVILGACRGAAPDVAAKKPEGAVPISAAGAKYIVVEPAGEEGSAVELRLPARIALRPDAAASLGSPVTGRVATIAVRPGEAVRAGAPLVTLQSADAAASRSALEQARARAASADEALRRNTEMMARGVGVESERVEAETKAREARAEYERARHADALLGGGERDRVVLRAPVSGVVTAVKASVGAVAVPGGDPLVEIGDPSRIWLVADASETDLGAIRRGQPATIVVPGADARLEGVVEGVGSKVDSESRRVPVYVALRAAPRGLAPGMHAEITLARPPSPGGITLPVAAVLIKNGTDRVVYVQRDDGAFVARKVRTGASAAGRVQIVEGVQRGERVVVKGALLVDGEAEQLL